MNLLVLKALLARMGVTDVAMARDGREAWQTLAAPGAPRLDAVLTDMWMPVMDGERLAKTIRSNPRFADLPVHVITADVELRRTYAGKGFSGIFLKPVTIEQLSRVLSGCRPSGPTP